MRLTWPILPAGSCPLRSRKRQTSCAPAISCEGPNPDIRRVAVQPADTPAAARAYSESQNAMQEVGVREAVMPSCRRELFALRNFGIGIRFEEIWNAVGREAKVYARISIKLQYSVDAFG